MVSFHDQNGTPFVVRRIQNFTRHKEERLGWTSPFTSTVETECHQNGSILMILFPLTVRTYCRISERLKSQLDVTLYFLCFDRSSSIAKVSSHKFLAALIRFAAISVPVRRSTNITSFLIFSFPNDNTVDKRQQRRKQLPQKARKWFRFNTVLEGYRLNDPVSARSAPRANNCQDC